jgi:hypothetical protein
MDRLALWLTWLLDGAARLLPSGRRLWVEAVRAEAGQVPAGRQRLSWIAGGLWLAVREANVARKIGYWLGIGAIAVIGGWIAWLGFLGTAATDAEAVTDRFRIVVLLTALVGLPWLARRHGLFGPVGPSVIARFVRVAGCAGLCGLGLIVLRIDAHAKGNIMGNGRFNPVEEFCGLAARIRQGTYAGITAGVIGGLLCTFIFLFFVFLIVLGPLIGVLGGRVGAALAADHLPSRRTDRSISADLFISD